MINRSLSDRLEYLTSNTDPRYKEFQCSLIPTVPKERVIGVRVPLIRKYVKSVDKDMSMLDFMSELPHQYYEEDLIHALIINGIRDYSECINSLSLFLPYVDNWACCDILSPRGIKENKDLAVKDVFAFVESKELYTSRFGIKMLMDNYLDKDFRGEYPEKVASVKSDQYYLKMMQAWYFATALSKRYDDVVPYIEQNRLDTDTHNKTIRKAVESYRITDEQKAYLKTLKR